MLDSQTFAQNPPYKKSVNFANIYTFICEKDINTPHHIKHTPSY